MIIDYLVNNHNNLLNIFDEAMGNQGCLTALGISQDLPGNKIGQPYVMTHCDPDGASAAMVGDMISFADAIEEQDYTPIFSLRTPILAMGLESLSSPSKEGVLFFVFNGDAKSMEDKADEAIDSVVQQLDAILRDEHYDAEVAWVFGLLGNRHMNIRF